MNKHDIISGYVELKKRPGGNYWGCCPFHDEKTPSFMVNYKKDIWHCFGCKRHGSLDALIEELEGAVDKEATKE